MQFGMKASVMHHSALKVRPAPCPRKSYNRDIFCGEKRSFVAVGSVGEEPYIPAVIQLHILSCRWHIAQGKKKHTFQLILQVIMCD